MEEYENPVDEKILAESDHFYKDSDIFNNCIGAGVFENDNYIKDPVVEAGILVIKEDDTIITEEKNLLSKHIVGTIDSYGYVVDEFDNQIAVVENIGGQVRIKGLISKFDYLIVNEQGIRKIIYDDGKGVLAQIRSSEEYVPKEKNFA